MTFTTRCSRNEVTDFFPKKTQLDQSECFKTFTTRLRHDVHVNEVIDFFILQDVPGTTITTCRSRLDVHVTK